jgi:hypothetical protein
MIIKCKGIFFFFPCYFYVYFLHRHGISNCHFACIIVSCCSLPSMNFQDLILVCLSTSKIEIATYLVWKGGFVINAMAYANKLSMGTNLLGVCPYVIVVLIMLEAILFHLYYLHLSCIQSVKLPSVSSAVNFWVIKCFSQAIFLGTLLWFYSVKEGYSIFVS